MKSEEISEILKGIIREVVEDVSSPLEPPDLSDFADEKELRLFDILIHKKDFTKWVVVTQTQTTLKSGEVICGVSLQPLGYKEVWHEVIGKTGNISEGCFPQQRGISMKRWDKEYYFPKINYILRNYFSEPELVPNFRIYKWREEEDGTFTPLFTSPSKEYNI